ncbi:MAG: NAD(P)H-hydrate dehydratase [Fimbriimonadales bacterium]|nr:NAD(P)H-hydrate dehydratase [Fimbriimonadales bacterium]
MDAGAALWLADPAEVVGAVNWIADSARCRQLDRQAVDAFGMTTAQLMEHAGNAVFRAVREMLPDGGRLTVVCGKGNNGGDGLVVARLAHRAGYHVDCLIAAHRHELSPDCAERLAEAEAAGVRPIFVDDEDYLEKLECVGCRDAIVDALLGTGAKGEVQGAIREAIEAINSSGAPVIAVDLPSGIHCDTGEELGESVWACRTVTFGLPKPFLFQGIGMEHAGRWTVDPIGFPKPLLEQHTDAFLLDDAWVGAQLPDRLRSSHKGDNGRVLIVAGSARYPGAAALTARGALRAGAGLVTVASVPSVCAAVAAQLPEACVLPLPEADGAIAEDAAAVIADSGRYDAAVFGPGLTTAPGVARALARLWMLWQGPSVLDADALNVISSEAAAPPLGPCVLTPHPGEMGRLMGASTAEVQNSRFAFAREAARRFGKAVLLKGAYSLAAEDEEPLLVNPTGNPGMACAGMGDVLSGVVGALLAQQMPGLSAAACAMFWHGLAGDLCFDRTGSFGFLASELADALPQARATILARCGLDSCS